MALRVLFPVGVPVMTRTKSTVLCRQRIRFGLKSHVNLHFRYHSSSLYKSICSNHLSLPVHFLRFIILLWQLVMVDGNGLLHPRGTVTLMHSLQFSINSSKFGSSRIRCTCEIRF